MAPGDNHQSHANPSQSHVRRNRNPEHQYQHPTITSSVCPAPQSANQRRPPNVALFTAIVRNGDDVIDSVACETEH